MLNLFLAKKFVVLNIVTPSFKWRGPVDGGAGPVGGPAEWRTGRDNQPDILGELLHGQAG